MTCEFAVAACVLHNIYVADEDRETEWSCLDIIENVPTEIQGLLPSDYVHQLSTPESRIAGKSMREKVFGLFAPE